MRERGETGSRVWTLRVELPTANSRRRWKTETFRGSELKAKQRLNQMVHEVQSSYVTSATSEKMTFQTLFNRWINGLSLTTDRERSASTKFQERARFNRHVKPIFGNRVVEKVSAGEIKLYYDDLRLGKHGQRALSSTSVARIHETLRAMCAWGVEKGLLGVNPLAGVKRPKISHPAPKAPEPESVYRLLNYLWKHDRQMWCAVRLAATTGIRRSELAALRWSDIHWHPGPQSITIERGILAVPGGRVVTQTKTGQAGRAVLPIDDALATALHRLRLSYTEADLAKRGSRNPRISMGYIFTEDPLGKTSWHPDTFTNKLRKATAAAGEYDSSIREVTFKSLRAFVASELAISGEDITTAQAVLRHKSSQTTMRHYAAARDRKVRQATLTLGERLNKSSPADDDVELAPGVRSQVENY